MALCYLARYFIYQANPQVYKQTMCTNGLWSCWDVRSSIWKYWLWRWWVITIHKIKWVIADLKSNFVYIFNKLRWTLNMWRHMYPYNYSWIITTDLMSSLCYWEGMLSWTWSSWWRFHFIWSWLSTVASTNVFIIRALNISIGLHYMAARSLLK